MNKDELIRKIKSYIKNFSFIFFDNDSMVSFENKMLSLMSNDRNFDEQYEVVLNMVKSNIKELIIDRYEEDKETFFSLLPLEIKDTDSDEELYRKIKLLSVVIKMISSEIDVNDANFSLEENERIKLFFGSFFERIPLDSKLYEMIIKGNDSFKKVIDTYLKNQKDQNSFESDEKEKHKILTDEELKTLYIRMNAGDETAKETILLRNLNLVRKYAGIYVKRVSVSSFSYDDLCQEGIIGLMKAIDRFNPAMGFKFSTYATWWIKQVMSRSIADHARTIRLPVHKIEQINKIRRQIAELNSKAGRVLSDEEIIKALDISKSRLDEISLYAKDAESLDKKVGKSEDTELSYFVGDSIDVEDTALDSMDSELLLDVVKTKLSKREYSIISQRFGFDTGRAMTLEEVGQTMGVSRERIRQIEAKALKKLRYCLRTYWSDESANALDRSIILKHKDNERREEGHMDKKNGTVREEKIVDGVSYKKLDVTSFIGEDETPTELIGEDSDNGLAEDTPLDKKNPQRTDSLNQGEADEKTIDGVRYKKIDATSFTDEEETSHELIADDDEPNSEFIEDDITEEVIYENDKSLSDRVPFNGEEDFSHESVVDDSLDTDFTEDVPARNDSIVKSKSGRKARPLMESLKERFSQEEIDILLDSLTPEQRNNLILRYGENYDTVNKIEDKAFIKRLSVFVSTKFGKNAKMILNKDASLKTATSIPKRDTVKQDITEEHKAETEEEEKETSKKRPGRKAKPLMEILRKKYTDEEIDILLSHLTLEQREKLELRYGKNFDTVNDLDDKTLVRSLSLLVSTRLDKMAKLVLNRDTSQKAAVSIPQIDSVQEDMPSLPDIEPVATEEDSANEIDSQEDISDDDSFLLSIIPEFVQIRDAIDRIIHKGMKYKQDKPKAKAKTRDK